MRNPDESRDLFDGEKQKTLVTNVTDWKDTGGVVCVKGDKFAVIDY